MSNDIEFLIQVVKKANEMISGDFEINAKDDKGDLVTNFDYEVEKFIIGELKREYPLFDIVSEEFNSNKELTDNCFTIDPIDGTANFAYGIPFWGIQIACIRNGETCASVIYLPKLDELYYADESGAYLNDNKICVSNLKPGEAIYEMSGRGDMLGSEMNGMKLSRRIASSAAAFSYVACGKFGGYCFRYDTLWDYMPGQYLVKQAGGYIYNEKGMHIGANSELFLQELINMCK